MSRGALYDRPGTDMSRGVLNDRPGTDMSRVAPNDCGGNGTSSIGSNNGPCVDIYRDRPKSQLWHRREEL